MKRVERSEILDYVTYGEQREAMRDSALRAKSVRRVLVGEYFTFLFENHETVLYQVQEMMRIEQIVKEDDIQPRARHLQRAHSSGGYGRLYASSRNRRRAVARPEAPGVDGSQRAHLREAAGRPLGATDLGSAPSWATRGCPRCSTSRSPLGPEAPVAIGIEMPGIDAETELSDAQREALRVDLSAG